MHRPAVMTRENVMNILNIATCRFVPLGRLPRLRSDTRARCKEPGLKGTVFLAEEGSNRFLASATADVESCPATLRQTGAGVTAADEPI